VAGFGRVLAFWPFFRQDHGEWRDLAGILDERAVVTPRA
jgi:hypothetical protein